MNRLSQHFAAITPQPIVSEPTPGEGHYKLTVFKPATLKGWKPTCYDDAPRELSTTKNECHDVLGSMNREFLPVYRDCLQYNRLARFRAGRKLPDWWSIVCWCDAGSPRYQDCRSRFCTPIEFTTASVFMPVTWEPNGPLCLPAGYCSTAHGDSTHETLGAAVRFACRQNRLFRKNKQLDKVSLWTIVVAAECEPVHDYLVHDWSGKSGIATVTATSRIHIVDESWPMSDATRARVARWKMKGGGEHDC